MNEELRPATVRDFDFVIDEDGSVMSIYDDGNRELLEGAGGVVIERAASVEPEGGSKWVADLSLSGGPLLGPFSTRRLALVFESEWLRSYVLGKAVGKYRTAVIDGEWRQVRVVSIRNGWATVHIDGYGGLSTKLENMR